MANLHRPYSKDKDNYKFGRCKKHPKHVQSPGVCSLCLKDKLYQLSTSSSSSFQKTNSASGSSSCSSVSSYDSSSSVSSCSSPPMHDDRSFSTKGKTIFLFQKHNGLVKSKSMTVVPRKRKDSEKNDYSSKKSGFWFKLFHPKSKKMVEDKNIFKMVRASSVRETVTVAS
ncbi:uncharacterized protein LOC123916369 [Trifolium pratense]|uniref:uncharacterized protein LOC123916369 n=1 Tax=Trifolium pratense TaxID=57577 RepID=UPI001E6929B6|nr:uncharacterized protein LOC123916369 [Trifolium pratense]